MWLQRNRRTEGGRFAPGLRGAGEDGFGGFGSAVDFERWRHGRTVEPQVFLVHLQQARKHLGFVDHPPQAEIGGEASVDELLGVTRDGQYKSGFAEGKTFGKRGIASVDDEGISASEQRSVIH